MGTEKKEGKVVTFFKNQKGVIITIIIAITILLIVYPKKETVVVEVEKASIHNSSEKTSTKKATATAAVVTVVEVPPQSSFKRGLWVVNNSGENLPLYAKVPIKGRIGEFKEISVCILGKSEKKFFPAEKGNILSFVLKRSTFLKENILLGYNFTQPYEIATANILESKDVVYTKGSPF